MKFPLALKENLREEDNLSTGDNWPVPNVSFVWRFYCRLMGSDIKSLPSGAVLMKTSGDPTLCLQLCLPLTPSIFMAMPAPPPLLPTSRKVLSQAIDNYLPDHPASHPLSLLLHLLVRSAKVLKL